MFCEDCEVVVVNAVGAGVATGAATGAGEGVVVTGFGEGEE